MLHSPVTQTDFTFRKLKMASFLLGQKKMSSDAGSKG